MSALFDEWCAKHGVTREERSALVAFLETFRAQRTLHTLRALAGAPSPPETPAPVHYLARFAAGSFIACDPTIKDGWTPDPLAVTCEECRKVVRWRCEQVAPPETPASEGGAERCACGEVELAASFASINGKTHRRGTYCGPPASPASAPRETPEAWTGVSTREGEILSALVSDEPDSKFDDWIVGWRSQVRRTVLRNATPDALREALRAALPPEAPASGAAVPDGYECPGCHSVYRHTSTCPSSPSTRTDPETPPKANASTPEDAGW